MALEDVQPTEVETGTTPPLPAADAAEASEAPTAQQTAREAFDRLAKGESPHEVNRELYSKPKAGTPGPAPSKTAPAAQPAASKAPPARASAPAGKPAAAVDPPANGDEQGVTPEDLAILKRAKFDLSAWKHIPPSNRKAIVANFKTTQAEADRQFQQARSGTSKGGNPAAGQQASAATDVTQDEGTLAGDAEQEDDTQQLPPAKQTKGQPPAARQAAAATAQGTQPEIDASAFIDPADLETLRELGGDDLANAHTRSITKAVTAAVGQMQQQQAPMVGVLNFLMGRLEAADFREAVSDLKTQPGLEALTDEQTTALRDKARLLIRAAGDPENYGFKEAVSDAAASLFKTNVQATAQAALLQRRQASLKGSPERGTGRIPADRPLTGKDRDRAIFEALSNGMGPDEARRSVDGR